VESARRVEIVRRAASPADDDRGEEADRERDRVDDRRRQPDQQDRRCERDRDRPRVPALEQPCDRQEQEHRVVVPQERRDKELPFYASAEKKDLEKLQSIANRLTDPAAALKPITDVIAQIKEDQQSKELLKSFVDDEMSSIKWLVEACQTLSAATPQAA